MLPISSSVSSVLAHELTRDRGVAFLRWPAQAYDRARLAAAGEPRLLIIDGGHTPPVVTDPLEDWVREPAHPLDLDRRLSMLADRARRRAELPRFDGDGLLWMGDRWVDIPDAQRPVADLLVARIGQVVRREEIVAACAAAGTSTTASAVKAMIGRVGRRFALLGLELRNVRGRGYLLQAVAGDEYQPTLRGRRLPSA
jgi:hypothetical protein